MVKKANVAGFAAGAAATQTTIKKIENEVKNTSNNIKKEVAKPVRKKKNPTYTIKRTKGKIEILTKADPKINKTYYLEQSCINTIESISKNTGLNPSEIIKIAIEELNNKLVYNEEINI